MQKLLTLLSLLLLLTNCTQKQSPSTHEIVNQAIDAHGQDLLIGREIAFTFRNGMYSSKRTIDKYTYTSERLIGVDTINDVLINGDTFFRINGLDTLKLSEVDAGKYGNTLNSVLYFIQLPYLLNDDAVIKSYQGTQEIKGQNYDVIKVTFKPTGGGEDFQDEYMYWFDAKSHLLDYLAYSYETNKGGVRFRSAYNRTNVEGMVFQDYINYEVVKDSPLNLIPNAFEKGELKELSRIENTEINVRSLKN
ncbi:MAG: hypothetical protein ACI83W_002031 [Marinoscillum sp.]|jgi:hypothetical protein